MTNQLRYHPTRPGRRQRVSAHQEFSTEAAREAARRDELSEWVAQFLASPGSDNAALAAALTDAPRWWLGPVQVPLAQLNRLAGPPGEPALEPMAEDEWRDDVDDLARRVEDGHEPPPVIASHVDGRLELEDGNHRVEALRRAGEDRAWTIISFETPAERDSFIARSALR
jgi:hypothetical protein